jgi:flavin-dependent dehydrogenase
VTATPDSLFSAETCDVVVIGGGPAGSTAAALLAERGVDVVLLEKDRHPRFHIGESLLPCNLPILQRLGVLAQVTEIGVHKPGAEIVSDDTGKCVAFPFALSRVKGDNHAYQVRRSEFDNILFDNARARGARTAEATRVVALDERGPNNRLRVTAETRDGPRVLMPRFVLDASGRDTFMAGRLGLKRSDKQNNTAAVFAHFRNVEPRRGDLRGYISIHLARDGWFWMIPLRDGVTSVGFVGTMAAFRERDGSMETFFAQRLQQSRTVRVRMRGAERVGEVIGTGNYSYRADRASGHGWMMIGDAFAFIDPVFSSGVLMAMSAGELGADVAAAWLADPSRGAALAKRSERELRAAMNRISWLIHRINTPVLREMLMAPRNTLFMRDGMVSLLAGHLGTGARARLPVLAFKATYHALSAIRCLSAEPRPSTSAE